MADNLLQNALVKREVDAAVRVRVKLECRDGVELISCPTCGRLQMDLIPIIEKVSEALKEFKHLRRPIQVAIMGCVVNGPGEADNADVAICAGKGKAVLYCHGQRLRNVKPEEIVSAVMEEVRALATEE